MAKKPYKPPSTRTKNLFAVYGWSCHIVERTICGAGIRKDFCGGIDQLALHPESKCIIGVQSFSTAWAEHYKKIILGQGDRGEYTVDEVKYWLRMPYAKFCFVGWRKLKVKRGGKAVRWMPRMGRVKLTKKGNLKLIEVSCFEDMIK